MKVIMISGKSQSGKDTLANAMKEELEQEGQRVLVIHFADPVKFFIKNYYNWDGNKDEHGRYLLQHIGTDTVRKRFPDYWANSIAKFINATSEDWDYVLIPDLRFLNEHNIVRKFNPNTSSVRIIRYKEDGSQFLNPLMTEQQLNHISECDLDDYSFDWYVQNFGDLNELKLAAHEVLENIKGE